MLSPCAHQLASALDGIGVPCATGILGMGKLVSVEASVDLLGTLVGESGSVRALESVDLCLEIRGPKQSYGLSPRETMLAMFAACGDRNMTQMVEEHTGLSLPGLPLAPFVWGLDSI